jgi:hypothetical protein
MTRRRGVGKAGTDRNQKTRAEPNLPSVARLCVKTICGEIRELATVLAPRLEMIGLYLPRPVPNAEAPEALKVSLVCECCADACFIILRRGNLAL